MWIAINIAVVIKRTDHGRSPIKTQKHVIFMRIVIMVAVLIKTQKYDIFLGP